MYVRMYACTHVCMYGAFEDNGTEIIKNVGKAESRVVSKLPIIFKRTRMYATGKSVYVGAFEDNR